MDTLHFCIAAVPLSVYFLLIGLINFAPRPLLTTGARDLAALMLALSGLVIVGPLELFLPEAVAAYLGGWVWLPLILLYALLATLGIMLMRPRLVVYNMTREQLRPLLVQAVDELDSAARWAGDSVVLPSLGVQLAIESYSGLRNLSLAAVGPDQNLHGWQKLRRRLQPLVVASRTSVNSHGLSFLILSMLLATAVVYALLTGRQEIAHAMRQMLRL